jgi:rhamnose transport system substrate-binding protein
MQRTDSHHLNEPLGETKMHTKLTRYAAVGFAMAMLAACGSDDKSSSDTGAAVTTPAGSAAPAVTGGAGGELKSGLTIAIIPKAINNAYFDAALVGAMKACTELGATCEQVGPTEATGAAQTEFINTEIQKGVDAIVISAADADSVTPSLQQAKAAGITVITYDADVNDTSARLAMIKPTTPELIATSLDQWISDAIGADGGEIAILSAAATAENQNAWIDLMKADLTANYPKLTLVDTVYGDDDAALSADKAAALLQSHPNLKGIISPTTVGVAATAKYLSGSEYKGKVQVTGLGLPSEMKAYLKDGTAKTVGLWDPGMLGYLGVYAAVNASSGNDLAAGFEAGGTSYTPDGDGVVIVGPPQEFTADNVDQFSF